MAIRSPLMRVSTLLSSITEFILSIQRVSTGPSNVIHFSSGFSSVQMEIGIQVSKLTKDKSIYSVGYRKQVRGPIKLLDS